MNAKTYELLAVSDVRPLDWVTGKRLPVDASDLPECVRCGRRHAVVWHLRELPSGANLTVGSGCGPKLLAEGLLPGVEFPAVKAAEKAFRAESRDCRIARAEERARELVAAAKVETADLVAPAATWEEDRYGRADWAVCSVGSSFRCVEHRSLELSRGEFGAETREGIEAGVARAWAREELRAALVRAGAPDVALYALARLAERESEGTLRDAAKSLLA